MLETSPEQNFIFPTQKYKDLKKWDITDPLTLVTWNCLRRLCMVMSQQESFVIENIFRLLTFFICFVGIYFIGISDKKFKYRIHFHFLSEPLIVGIMINEFVLVIMIIMRRINYSSQFNIHFESMYNICENLKIKVSKMSQVPEQYLNYTPSDFNEYSIEYAIKARILLRFLIKLI